MHPEYSRTSVEEFERKIPEVVADFCTYYASHRNKTVVYYYDATALGSNYAVNEQDFRWVVVHEFERHGWTVEAVYLAIQAAGVSRGRNGFRKDKGGEKLAESEEDLLEHRTDGTDAFDTLYIGAEKFPYHDSFSINVSGVV